jgi:hypothetical protein
LLLGIDQHSVHHCPTVAAENNNYRRNDMPTKDGNPNDIADASAPKAQPATVPGLSDDQRAQLRNRLQALASGIGGTVPIAETMEAPGSSHWNYWS